MTTTASGGRSSRRQAWLFSLTVAGVVTTAGLVFLVAAVYPFYVVTDLHTLPDSTWPSGAYDPSHQSPYADGSKPWGLVWLANAVLNEVGLLVYPVVLVVAVVLVVRAWRRDRTTAGIYLVGAAFVATYLAVARIDRVQVIWAWLAD